MTVMSALIFFLLVELKNIRESTMVLGEELESHWLAIFHTLHLGAFVRFFKHSILKGLW